MKENSFTSQWELKVKATKLPKARENAGDQVAIGFSLHLIGWKRGTSFLDQSQSEVRKTNAISDYFRFSIENCPDRSFLDILHRALHLLFVCLVFFSFQMSNVEAGGGTVFTQVGTTLFPSQVREMLIV